MDYLQWHKTRRRVRYELTASGVTFVRPEELDLGNVLPSLEVWGTYGDPEVVATLAARYAVKPEQVLPVPGASSANFVALAATTRPGDRVLFETPTYDPLLRVAAFLRLEVVPLPRRASDQFEIRLDDLEAGLRGGARCVVLTNLHNPTGRMISREHVERIAGLCAAMETTLLVDEAYLDGASMVARRPIWSAAALADNVVTTNSLTKVYGLAGLRVGWMLARPDTVERGRRIVDMLHVDNPAPSADLALRALARVGRLEQRFLRIYQQGQDVFRRWLGEQPQLTGYPSHGALFECLRLPAEVSGDALHELLVTRYDTQVVPGRFFGLPDHIRVGTAVPPADLAEGLSRLNRAANELMRGRRGGD